MMAGVGQSGLLDVPDITQTTESTNNGGER